MATETARAIEAILMVADQPVPPELFAQLLELQLDQVTAVIDELMAGYEVEDRGFILTKVAGGYRYQSHADLAPYVERFVLEGQTARLSAAALETLAIIAYKQPISRAQVAQVRGVNVDGVVKTLEQRGYIAEIGRDPGPGNPSLFGTTDEFLLKLGLASLADLPPIAGFVPGPDVVEQLEHGLRADIDAETAAYVAGLAERADDVAAAEEAEEAGDTAAADAAAGVAAAVVLDDITGEPVADDGPDPGAADGPADAEDATEDLPASGTEPSAVGAPDAPGDEVVAAGGTDAGEPTATEPTAAGAGADGPGATVGGAVDPGPAIDHDGSFGGPADALAGVVHDVSFADPDPDPDPDTDLDPDPDPAGGADLGTAVGDVVADLGPVDDPDGSADGGG